MKLALAVALMLGAARLDETQVRGKQIYLRGESPRGTPIVARMGAEGVEVPATIVPCASCHGYDGRGRAEGGVRPSNLQWDVLTKPYAVPGERRHPAYTRSSLKRAITMGTDPAGNVLQPAMPRYRMSIADMEDLLAYLQKLQDDIDPGLTDDAIRVAIHLPPGEPGARVKARIETYLEALARNGGIFGRRIDPRFGGADEPFAVVAGHLKEEQLAAAESHQLLTIAGTSAIAPTGRYTFVLANTGQVPQELASLAVLVEALRRAGRDVSREKLIATLEGFYEVDLGLGFKVTFGPTRRVSLSKPGLRP